MSMYMYAASAGYFSFENSMALRVNRSADV